MPPKKKGKGEPVIIDGVDTTQMTREELEVFALRIKEENEREREERNLFQLERDKLRTFWEITRTELEEARTKFRNKDLQIEKEAENNEKELKFYKQKAKHLQYLHQHDLAEAKAEGLDSLKLVQDECLVKERKLLQDKRELKMKEKDSEASNMNQIKSIKMWYSDKLSEARHEYENNIQEIDIRYEKMFIKLKTEMGIKHRMEEAALEERKNNHINELIKNHDKAFTEMKTYYNDITLNNLALINSLKAKMEVLLNQNERMSRQAADLINENKKLTEPLRKASADMKEYERKLENYNKDKLCLANTKSLLAASKKEMTDLKWEHDALELRFEKLQLERDRLHNNFVNAILEVQQKTGLKNVLLQKRIRLLNENVQKKNLFISKLEETTEEPVVKLNRKLEKILERKNAMIHDLRYDIAKVTKAHDDLLDAYEGKLMAYGIPKEELEYVPLHFIPKNQSFRSTGPAGLITQKK